MGDDGKDDKDFLSLKQQGNDLFKSGKFKDALKSYSEALRLAAEQPASDRAAILKNQAACYLKLDENGQCVTAASQGKYREAILPLPCLRSYRIMTSWLRGHKVKSTDRILRTADVMRGSSWKYC